MKSSLLYFNLDPSQKGLMLWGNQPGTFFRHPNFSIKGDSKIRLKTGGNIVSYLFLDFSRVYLKTSKGKGGTIGKVTQQGLI